MGLFGLVKGVVGLAEDAVDGTINTVIDVVKGDVDAAGERILRTPEQIGKRLDEMQANDDEADDED